MPSPARPWLRVLQWLLAAAAVITLGLLRWGADLLIASYAPLPERVDAAIVLQGSIVAEKARIAGAMDLLRRGVADRALLSVPKESYWGQSVPPVARSFLERTLRQRPRSPCRFLRNQWRGRLHGAGSSGS